MVIYKCDKCGEINDYAHEGKILVLDRNGMDKKIKIHLCNRCEDKMLKMNTDFLYGDGAYNRAKEAHNFAMSYAM